MTRFFQSLIARNGSANMVVRPRLQGRFESETGFAAMPGEVTRPLPGTRGIAGDAAGPGQHKERAASSSDTGDEDEGRQDERPGLFSARFAGAAGGAFSSTQITDGDYSSPGGSGAYRFRGGLLRDGRFPEGQISGGSGDYRVTGAMRPGDLKQPVGEGGMAWGNLGGMAGAPAALQPSWDGNGPVSPGADGANGPYNGRLQPTNIKPARSGERPGQDESAGHDQPVGGMPGHGQPGRDPSAASQSIRPGQLTGLGALAGPGMGWRGPQPLAQEAAPIIRVTIGRIEVKAAGNPAPQETRKSAQPKKPRLSLDQFLKAKTDPS